MKFLQILVFYENYLSDFYQKNRNLSEAPFKKQIEALVRDGFGAGHIFAPYISDYGYKSELIIANCRQAQMQWVMENGTKIDNAKEWFFEIVKKQVETFKPDILYLSDPINFDSSFVRTLSWKPALILGWRAAPISERTNWTEFDVIVSNFPVCRKKAIELGAKSTEYFAPGFPEFISDILREQTEEWDVVFSGSWMSLHGKRNSCLMEVAKAPLGTRGEFSIGYFIQASQPASLPAGVAMHNHGSRWGIKMFRALKSGRIVLNAHLDMAQSYGANMRMFETTGTGSFLLTDFYENTGNYFKPGVEIETFQNNSELIEKIYYYLEHPDEREAIARRGQERCLRDYSIKVRTQELDNIIRKHLSSKSKYQKMSNGEILIIKAVNLLNAQNNIDALNILEKVIRISPDMHVLNYGKAVALARLGKTATAVKTLSHLLDYIPDHQKAKNLLEGINSQTRSLNEVSDASPYSNTMNIHESRSNAEAINRNSDNTEHQKEEIMLQTSKESQKMDSYLENKFGGVTFGNNVQIIGIKNLRVGAGTCIGDDSWLNVCIRDEKTRMRIGKCVLIGRRGTISTAGYLEIGDYTTLAPNVFVSDADHEYKDIMLPVLSKGITANRSVCIEENCWFAINSVVTGNLTIGRGSVIGANAVVLKDVPPFSVVVGNPSRIVKMYDPLVQKWIPVRTADDCDQIMQNREKAGIPSREQYRMILSKSGMKNVSPIVAGRGEHLF